MGQNVEGGATTQLVRAVKRRLGEGSRSTGRLGHRVCPSAQYADGLDQQGSADPEPSPAGLFGGHHVRKWLPAKHRRPQTRKVMPGLARRNACKMLVESSGRLSWCRIRRAIDDLDKQPQTLIATPMPNRYCVAISLSCRFSVSAR